MRRSTRLILLNNVAMSDVWPSRVRRALVRRLGVRVGDSWIKSRSTFGGTNVEIGDGSHVNHFCFFDGGPVQIGNNCNVSVGTKFMSRNHESGDSFHRAGPVIDRPIRVEDGAWIGASSTVLGGVTIARGCVIAAGAVVAKDTEPNGLYGGIPARRIKDLP